MSGTLTLQRVEAAIIECISIEDRKQKKVNRKPVITQSKTTEQPEARENAGDQVAIDLNFEFDWFRNRREFSGPIKK